MVRNNTYFTFLPRSSNSIKADNIQFKKTYHISKTEYTHTCKKKFYFSLYETQPIYSMYINCLLWQLLPFFPFNSLFTHSLITNIKYTSSLLETPTYMEYIILFPNVIIYYDNFFGKQHLVNPMLFCDN